VKFSVKSVYPISTSLCATNCRASWESVTVEVEYLFMGDSNREHRQITEGNDDFRYIGISMLSGQLKINENSRGYRLSNTVPT
jgi:hypothetical protein